MRLTEVDDELTLRTRSNDSSPQTASVVEPVATPNETDREYYAAEIRWLADLSQDSTDREFEAVERS